MARMHERNYIGATGAATLQEVDHLSFTCNKVSSLYNLGIDHEPMIGILASTKTLLGQTTPNRRYPRVEDIPDLFRQVNYGFRVVHFNSHEQTTLSDQLRKLFNTKGLYDLDLSRAAQLNNAWPPLDQIKEAQKYMPDLKVILQLSGKSMQGKTPDEIAGRVADYGDSIRHVLVDPSGGWGKEFDIDFVHTVFEALKYKNPGLLIGFAGGLSGDNVGGKCAELAKRIGHKHFSIDAESGLRDKLSKAYGDDIYNEFKSELYLHRAASFFSPDPIWTEGLK